MAQKTADLQEKIYILHEKLQDWAKQLPLQIQQRMSCELLANLASYLLNDPTIFEIVNSLLDIQHIIEKELFHERIELKNKHVLEHELLETMGLPPDEFVIRKDILVKRHAEEVKEFDVGIIMKLDQKVTEQQMVLETAGLPSFRVTNNPLEIQFVIASQPIPDTDALNSGIQDCKSNLKNFYIECRDASRDLLMNYF